MVQREQENAYTSRENLQTPILSFKLQPRLKENVRFAQGLHVLWAPLRPPATRV